MKLLEFLFFNYMLAFGGDKGVWWRQGRMGNQMVETRAYAVKIMKMSMSFMDAKYQCLLKNVLKLLLSYL